MAFKHLAISAGTALLLAAAPAAAQGDRSGFELGVQVPSTVSSEFDATGVGIGARVAWRTGAWLGAEAEFDTYPGDFPGDAAFSSGRVEGLFGATVGPRIGRVRPFAKLRPGFMTFQEAPEPFGCVAIFPPPLACTLAAGRTVFALDAGGGVEFSATPRAFLRLDAGDLLVRYPGPTRDSNFEERDSFFSHDFRFAVGFGVRF